MRLVEHRGSQLHVAFVPMRRAAIEPDDAGAAVSNRKKRRKSMLLIVLSRFGATGAVQLLPSADHAMRRSVRFRVRTTLLHPVRNERTVRHRADRRDVGGVHHQVVARHNGHRRRPAAAVRSANFNVDFVPSRSTQLSTSRSPWTVISGTELFALVGELRDSTLNPAGSCALAIADHIARPPTIPIHVCFVPCSTVSLCRHALLRKRATSATRSDGIAASKRNGAPLAGCKNASRNACSACRGNSTGRSTSGP